MGDEATTGVETETNDTGAADTGDTGDTSTVLTGDAGDTGTADTDGTENSETGADTASADDAGTSDGSDSDAGTEGSDTPPDTYADFVMPEGIELDESALAEATPMFKELGLTQEQSQKVIDLYAKQVQAGSQTQIDNFNQLMNDWREQSKNDGEIGGDKFEENVKIAQSAISKYGTPGLKQLLEDHGVGNHPEVIRFMVRVGQTLNEDVPGSSGAATNEASDRVERMYPKEGT